MLSPFTYYTKCILPDDDLLLLSKHVCALINTYILNCVDCCYVIILKNNGMSSLKIADQVSYTHTNTHLSPFYYRTYKRVPFKKTPLQDIFQGANPTVSD